MGNQRVCVTFFIIARLVQLVSNNPPNGANKIRLVSNIPGLIPQFRKVLLTGTRLKTPSCRIQFAGPSRNVYVRDRREKSSLPFPSLSHSRTVHLERSGVQREEPPRDGFSSFAISLDTRIYYRQEENREEEKTMRISWRERIRKIFKTLYQLYERCYIFLPLNI